MTYSTFRDFVDTARSGPHKQATFSERTVVANSARIPLQQEGVAPAIFRGHHIYVKLELRPSLITSSRNEDRMKCIELLADLTQGVREIIHRFDGALLEAQGPVVHAFLPDNQGNFNLPRLASAAIHDFVDQRIKPRAKEDFNKALIAYCHGPSIFVASVDLHGDNSIVSLAPAANAPAKVLWQKGDRFPSGASIEVNADGTYKQMPILNREALLEHARTDVFNASNSLPYVQVEAKQATVAPVGSPDSPTVADPDKFFAISIRADMDGFTSRVQSAFTDGSAMELAYEFHDIMVHARSFATDLDAIHLPWAGDCFNLLLAFEDREDYGENRKRKILQLLVDFEKHMRNRFPDAKWSYSCAAGDLENAQQCNTLVSRLNLGHTTLLLATGLPVERSLLGLANESPKAGEGVLWKGDVSSLDDDLKQTLRAAAGGENFRHFALIDVDKANKKSFFTPPQPAYASSPITAKAASIAAPIVRPYF